MTLEQDISDLKNAFKEYVELKKNDEVKKYMRDHDLPSTYVYVELKKNDEVKKYMRDHDLSSKYAVEDIIDDKYKYVMQYLG